ARARPAAPKLAVATMKPEASAPEVAAPIDKMPEHVTPDPLPALIPPPVDPAPPKPAPIISGPLVSLGQLAVHGSLATTIVNRALERVLDDLRACRRAAPPSADLVVHTTFTIDESGHAVGVHASGGGALSTCVAASVGRTRTASVPDVGTV